HFAPRTAMMSLLYYQASFVLDALALYVKHHYVLEWRHGIQDPPQSTRRDYRPGGPGAAQALRGGRRRRGAGEPQRPRQDLRRRPPPRRLPPRPAGQGRPAGLPL